MKKRRLATDTNPDYSKVQENDLWTKRQLEQLECICATYLQVLDRQQCDVVNVRKMHHDVWRDMHQTKGILECRAGSRVERITRILPVGDRSDVDYKLHVDGVEVEINAHGNLYLEICSTNKAYGKVYVSKNDLESFCPEGIQRSLFENVIAECPSSGRAILKPCIFKENVVKYCQIEMTRSKDINSPKTSPAVSGEGALNPYDLVPCLKLKSWPQMIRREVLEKYTLEVESQIGVSYQVPMFVVPTGDPASRFKDYEWRLSFAMLEIEIFKQITAHQRQLYGISKFVFKVVFGEIDLLSSYHVKVLFLKMLEIDDLATETPVSFAMKFLGEIADAAIKRYVPHYFIANCNIFPFHKVEERKLRFYQTQRSRLPANAIGKIRSIIGHDFGLVYTKLDEWLEVAKSTAEEKARNGVCQRWVDGYLTRLLSVIWYCLQKSALTGDLRGAVENLKALFNSNKEDKHVRRIIPMVTLILQEEFSCEFDLPKEHIEDASNEQKDQRNLLAIAALVAYAKGQTGRVRNLRTQFENLKPCGSTIGVTITKFHQRIDDPLLYVSHHMLETYTSNRFYVAVDVLFNHLEVQDCLLRMESKADEHSTDIRKQEICSRLDHLCQTVSEASDHEPYFGKVSYKHAGYILLKGYQRFFSQSKCLVRNCGGQTTI